MEGEENVVAEDYDASSIQNDTKTNLCNNISDDKITVLNNPFEKLEKQAEEFENLCKQMSLDVQNSYKEYLTQQNEITKTEKNSFKIENFLKEYEEKIESESQLINSLKVRIEELEIDSIIKNQDIKKLRQEFNDLKKKEPVLAQSVSSTKNENGKDLRIIGSNDRFNGEEMVIPSPHDDYENFTLAKKQPKSSKNENNPQIVASADTTTKIDQISKPPLISIVNIFIKNRQIHSRITATINNFMSRNKKINDKAFYHLFNEFTINDLLAYERSNLFYSLDDESKRCFIKYINDSLKRY